MVQPRLPTFSELSIQLETLLETFLDKLFARWASGHVQPLELARRLVRAMEDGQAVNTEGRLVAPNHYCIYLSPDDYASLGGDESAQQLADELATHLRRIAHQVGLALDPAVQLLPDPGVLPGLSRVEAHWCRTTVSPLEYTTETPPVSGLLSPSISGWYLVSADRRYGLDRAVLNLGRALDNHIIIEDLRVSRHHAQLRYRDGSWLLFDLDSSFGTCVNGTRIRESIVGSGDTISLGGVEFKLLLV